MSPRPPAPHRPEEPTLLDRVTAGALEPDYQAVAGRRAARPGSASGTPAGARRLGPRVLTASVLAAFVVLVVTAGLENRQDEPGDTLVRETLVATATERRATLDRLQDEVAAAQADNAAVAARASRAAEGRAEAVSRLRRVATASGFQAVRGPGLLLTLRDAPEAGELIRSDDLALLVDGLWEAGAEAIAVNGERLTARSALTTTNVSININRRPLTAPYLVRAVGDRTALETGLAETQGGVAWQLLVQEFGFGYEIEARAELELPAAPDLLVRTCDACFPDLADDSSGQQPEE